MDDITKQVTLLYELSLTTLKNLDPFDTCKHFLTKFLSRQALNYGAIWMEDQVDHDATVYYQKLFASPNQEEFVTLKNEVTPLFKNERQIITRDSSIFNEVRLPGYYSYYPLKEIGLIEINSRKYPEKINVNGLKPYKDVFDQLALSLKSGFSYMLLQQEVKQRKAAQESLRVNELKFRNIINNIKLGLIEVDPDQVIQYANDAFLNLMGYSLDEIKGKKATELFLDDPNDSRLNEQRALREQKVSSTYELVMRDRNGNRKWAIISGSPNYDSKGKIIGSIGIHLDITKQKELEEENEFRSLQLKKLHEMSLDALVTVDEEGKIFQWSHQATQVFGYEKNEIIGKNVLDVLVPQVHREVYGEVLSKYLKNRKGPLLNKRLEGIALHKNGNEFQVEFSVIYMQYQGQHYFNTILRDITQMKTTQLNMEKALDRQRELNDLKSQFISTTSHELRTPLTTIKSNTEIINYLLDNTESVNKKIISKNINRIEANTDRLNQLINNILMIGRLDSKKIPFEPELVDLSNLIRHQIIPDINSLDREINFTEIGTPYKSMIDKRLIRHVMTNLLENALKYSTEKNDPEITLKFLEEEVQIDVKDHGIGIPEKDQQRLFDTFFRASNVDNIQGTGLGLSIVKEYIKMHRGTINLKSKLNVGTTFTILLPKLITHGL